MKYIISRYNHDISWLKGYTDNFVMYDRSDSVPQIETAISVRNVGSDIFDKFTFIIDNYDDLPEVAVYTKANLFKYISKEEFDLVKDAKFFTPLLTQNHKTYSDDRGEVCFYKDGIYWERNDLWYLNTHKPKSFNAVQELMGLLGTWNMKYVPFAPGSNYILTKKNILKHLKEHYIKLRSFIDWDVYPGECQILERGLYTLWS